MLDTIDEADKLGEELEARYEKSMVYNEPEKRLYAELPWLNEDRPQCNYHSAVAQAKSLRDRLVRDGTYDAYDEVIRTLVREGTAEKVEHVDTREGYYIPHHPVFKAESTTKIRPVFNASQKVRGTKALNDCIFVGAWKPNNLMTLLIRWRLHKCVLLGDIKKAFLAIRVHVRDRKYLRFIWFEGGKEVVYQMTSVLFGATSSPYMLHAALHRLITDHAEPAAKDFTRWIYMDDALFTCSSIPELVERVAASRRALEKGSFELHKWAAPKWLREQLPADLNIQFGESNHKALGNAWNLDTDEIIFHEFDCALPKFTRRELASLFGRPFDPMGLLGPVFNRLRIFMRKVGAWSSQFKDKTNKKATAEWDAPLSAELVQEAILLIDDLKLIVNFRVPRACVTSAFDLYFFADASSAAYGVCVYGYPQVAEGDVRGVLLMSRGRLSSPNRTIPQLELIAATLAAETYSVLKAEFASAKCVRFFTDSSITLCRIQGVPNSKEPFVRNRVLKIQEQTKSSDWGFVSTKHNPADVISRGQSAKLLLNNELWLKGPRASELGSSRALAMYTQALDLTELHELNRKLSDTPYIHLLVTFTTLMQFMQSRFDYLSRVNAGKQRPVALPQLAVIRLWQHIQRETLGPELSALRKGNSVGKKSKVAHLRLFIDEWGLLRHDRRLERSELPYDSKFPIVLLNHPLTRGYIEFVHSNRLLHAGQSMTSAYLKRSVELVGLSQTIRFIRRNCARCRRFHAPPYAPEMAPLPKERVTERRAFATVGIDIFGPLDSEPMPKLGAKRKKASSEKKKYYGLIFVCASSRAIHIELLGSREFKDVRNAIYRFISRRGVPERFFSDNEKSFTKCGKMLDIYNQIRRCESTMAKDYPSIRWTFNPPRTPHWGGFYERCIATVKNGLLQFKPQRAYTFDELQTILAIVEALVNTRPLIQRGNDLPSITPADLVLGHSLLIMPNVHFTQKDTLNDTLINYTGFRKKLGVLWRIWREEYLTSLRKHAHEQSREPQVGDLVFVDESPAPRGEWSVGQIKELIPGRDNVSRVARVQLLKDKSDVIKVVQKLVPLEPEEL